MRRSRIKAIANVPIRRRVETSETPVTLNNEEKPTQEVPKQKEDAPAIIKKILPSTAESSVTTTETSTVLQPILEVTAQLPDSPTNITSIPQEEDPLKLDIPKTEVKDENANTNTIKVLGRSRIKVFAKIPERKKIAEVQADVEPEIKSHAKPLDIKILCMQTIPPASPSPSILPSPTHYPEFGATYPRPPASPHKLLNRPRIRSTPRLGHRRNSTSASESEDESRRNYMSRVRNDSVSSVAQLDESNCGANIENVPHANLHSHTSGPPKKKQRRSDIARKMAEARKEFYYKFGSKTPDRNKLTMMDLIFYNPTSNPMPVKPKKDLKSDQVEETVQEAAIVEEEADEPEEEAMPVPQVKIGENGELILDEQSLVIETTESRKPRELTTTAINYDDLDTGYGIYKRCKRTKDWTVAETKQFYRVLQMIGTDFSMMLAYFKNRTRRDLKLKFKKEEKINQTLIDKVLANPCTFDLDELQKMLDKDQEILKQQEEEKRKEREVKEAESEKRKISSNRGRIKKKYKTGSHFARQMYTDNEKAGECMNLPPKSKRVRSYELESPSTIYLPTTGRPRKQKYYELEDSSSQADDPDEVETSEATKKSVKNQLDEEGIESDKETTEGSTLPIERIESLSGFKKQCDEEIEHWKNKKTDDGDELSEEALKLLEEVKTVFSTLNNNGES